MTKTLHVSNPLQVRLLNEFIIPEVRGGVWKNHRPLTHVAAWEGVQVIHDSDDFLGPKEWEVPRLYNFLNPPFMALHEEAMMAIVRALRPDLNERRLAKLLKTELGEISQITGGRLTSKTGTATKAYRGKPSETAQARENISKAENAVKRTAKKVIDVTKQHILPKEHVRNSVFDNAHLMNQN